MNLETVRLFRNIGAMCYDLFVHERDTKLKRGVIKMVEADPNTYSPPTLQIDEAQAQALMDDLWAAGLRPAEGSGSAGSLLATQRHLADMRQLAFAKIEVPKPEDKPQ
jgi:hypothetical protein